MRTLPYFPGHEIPYRFFQPFGAVDEVVAPVGLVEDFLTFFCDDIPHRQGIFFYLRHSGVADSFFFVPQGQVDFLYAGRKGMGFQVIHKPIEPEGAGNGGDGLKAVLFVPM